MSRLARILESKRAEIARGMACDHPALAAAGFDVKRALGRGVDEVEGRAPLRLLAEVKLRSPSAGELSHALDPAARAVAYAEAGATVVSILCDAPFFGGSFEHLAAARRALDAAGLRTGLLAKEFVLDPVQLDWARAHGADAVLLIVRILSPLSPSLLAELVAASRARGLEPLVEITDEGELDQALAAGASVLGVNARDLDNLAIDRARAARVLAAIPEGHVAVRLSGVRTADDVRALARTRADAVLLGEALMREPDPRALLRSLVAATG